MYTLLRSNSLRACLHGRGTLDAHATYHLVLQHGLATRRSFQIINLDPAAEHFKYPVSLGACLGILPEPRIAVLCNGVFIAMHEYIHRFKSARPIQAPFRLPTNLTKIPCPCLMLLENILVRSIIHTMKVCALHRLVRRDLSAQIHQYAHTHKDP
jgi:hypothetical protein